MGISDVLNAAAIKKENEKLHQIIHEMGAGDAISIKNRLEQYQNELSEMERRKTELLSQSLSLTLEVQNKKSQVIVLDDELLFESFALYKPKFEFQTSDEYRIRLEACRDEQKRFIKTGGAVVAYENWTVNNSAAEGKKMVDDIKKLVLRSFNNECDYCVDNVKFSNIEVQEKRILKSFETLNSIGRFVKVRISDYYRNLKLDELHIAYEYQVKKEKEKEEQKRAREELREQQKLEAEIRIARERIMKERRHFSQAIQELETRLKATSDKQSQSDLQNRLDECKSQLSELDKEEKVIDYREQNAKAGYVYVISNIGAFGENIFKIGMTRRLEPMERIDELGDASVPFNFDVHAMIFSDNAPTLEGKIHDHFYKDRLNKLNDRKEFFKADIHEIEKVIKENYDKVVDVVEEAPAQQYRESKLL